MVYDLLKSRSTYKLKYIYVKNYRMLSRLIFSIWTTTTTILINSLILVLPGYTCLSSPPFEQYCEDVAFTIISLTWFHFSQFLSFSETFSEHGVTCSHLRPLSPTISRSCCYRLTSLGLFWVSLVVHSRRVAVGLASNDSRV